MYRRPSYVAHVLDGDRAVLLHLPSARRVVLTPTATRTWQLLLELGDLDDVVDTLTLEYAARRKAIDHDVRVLIADLVEQDLLEEVPDEPARRRSGWRRRWRRYRSRVRPPFRSVRFLVALGVAVVAFVALSGWAASVVLRPTAAPPPPAVAPQSGALAVVASGEAWRALNASPCGSGAAPVAVQRLSGTSWVAAASPLARVDQLAFASTADGVAVGVDATCQPAYAVTTDGGRSWWAGSPARALISASVGAAGGSSVWVLDASGSGQPRLLRFTPDMSLEVGGGSRAVPCGQQAGPPALLAAVDDNYGLVLCQGASGEGRLLLRTTTGGQYWDRLTDARPTTGLDLTGSIRGLSFPSSGHGYALGDAAACPAGQLRESVDAGQTWAPLPCLPGLTQVLSVAFSSDRDGLVLGRSGDVVTVLRTTDGGRTWGPIR